MKLSSSKILKSPLKTSVSIIIITASIAILTILIINKKSYSGDNSIPFDISTGRPVVEIMINGKGPYRFIFDTGASGSVIDDSVAQALGLEVKGEVRVGSPGTDKTTNANLVLADLLLGSANFENYHLVSMAGIKAKVNVDGILSYSILSDYVLTINYPNSRLEFNNRELEKSKSLSYTSPDRIITIKMNVDGNEIDCHLDTGSKFGFTLPNDIVAKLKLKYEPVEGPKKKTMNGEISTKQTQLDGSITFGGITYKDPEFDFTEQFSNFGNLGYQILKQLSVTIDQKNHLIQFERTGENK